MFKPWSRLFLLTLILLCSLQSSFAQDANPKLLNSIADPYPAPPFQGVANWVNASPLQITDLHGKVVLVVFWTYTCHICAQVLPYLNSWQKQYGKEGLVIVGIHSPNEWDKVKTAVKSLKITYPVTMDAHLATTKNWHMTYWPTLYLIDQQGRVVYKHQGAGDYQVTEHNIKALLSK